jgi:hypothetical protein
MIHTHPQKVPKTVFTSITSTSTSVSNGFVLTQDGEQGFSPRWYASPPIKVCRDYYWDACRPLNPHHGQVQIPPLPAFPSAICLPHSLDENGDQESREEAQQYGRKRAGSRRGRVFLEPGRDEEAWHLRLQFCCVVKGRQGDIGTSQSFQVLTLLTLRSFQSPSFRVTSVGSAESRGSDQTCRP